MIGYFTSDLVKGAREFENWSENSELRCFKTLLEYEKGEGRLLWKKWTPVQATRTQCLYRGNVEPNEWLGDYKCSKTKNCRNMRTVSHTPFEKEDYHNFQHIMNTEDREFYCNMIAIQKKLVKRLDKENASLSEQK